MNYRLVAPVLVALMVLCGCALWRPRLPTGKWTPQPVGGFEAPVRLRQRLTIEAGSREVTFPVVLEISRDRATFNVLSPVGSRILTVRQSNSTLSVDSSPNEDFPLNARRLYLGVQLMIWPTLMMNEPYTVRRVEPSGGIVERRVFRSGKRIATIKAPSFSSYNGERTLTFGNAPYVIRLKTRHVTTLGGNP